MINYVLYRPFKVFILYGNKIAYVQNRCDYQYWSIICIEKQICFALIHKSDSDLCQLLSRLAFI